MRKLSKLNLKKIDLVELSKEEMKSIIGAESGCSASSCVGSCSVLVWGIMHYGSCDWDTSTGSLQCGCKW